MGHTPSLQFQSICILGWATFTSLESAKYCQLKVKTFQKTTSSGISTNTIPGPRIFCKLCVTVLCHNNTQLAPLKNFSRSIQNKMRTYSQLQFQNFPMADKKIYQILFILSKTTQQIFCELCIMHSSGAMTHSKQTFWLEQGNEILIFQTVNLFCDTAMYGSPGLHLQALPCHSLHYTALQSQPSFRAN